MSLFDMLHKYSRVICDRKLQPVRARKMSTAMCPTKGQNYKKSTTSADDSTATFSRD